MHFTKINSSHGTKLLRYPLLQKFSFKLICTSHVVVSVNMYRFINLHTHSGVAPVSNGMATVTLEELACGVTYTIIAGGRLDGNLLGPTSSYGTITFSNHPCPEMTTVNATLSVTGNSIATY